MWKQFPLNLKDVPEDQFIINAREDKKKAIEKIVNDVRQQEIARKINIEKNNENLKKTKELNLKNVTTDTSGNPVPVKGVNIDKLADLFLFSRYIK